MATVTPSSAPLRSPLTLRQRARIRWRARHINDPVAWREFVEFEELVASSVWSVPRNVDELNERYADVPRD